MTEVSLIADCSRCVALCCVAPAFDRSPEFAIDKAAGVACPNLDGANRCTIHDTLQARGFGGCVRFDCHGAGQRVTAMFGGRRWRDGADMAAPMFDAFRAMRKVHELILLLRQARGLPLSADQRSRCDDLLAQLQPETWTPESLMQFEQGEARRDVLGFLTTLRHLVPARTPSGV